MTREGTSITGIGESADGESGPGARIERAGDDLVRVVGRLVDRQEIVDLVHRYSYLIDHRMFDEVLDLFTDDCVVDYGPAIAPPINGRDALREMYSSQSADDPYYVASSHHNANVLVTFDGPDRANVRTSVAVWHRTSDGGEPRIWGYYYDVVERTSAGWRLAARQLRVAGSQGFEAEWLPLVTAETELGEH